MPSPEKPVNIRMIAERAQCSTATVSRVLSGAECRIKISPATREKIMRVCAELDYRPSIHALRFFSKRSRVIGFLPACALLPEDDNLGRTFFFLCEELARYNYRVLPLLFNPTFLADKEYLALFQRNEIDALIVWGAGEDAGFLDELAAANRPFLPIVNRAGTYPAVYTDQFSPVAALTRQCVANGARKIAGIMASDGDSYRQRRAGFEAAAAECPGEFRQWLLDGASIHQLQLAYELAPTVLAWRPDAIVCCNDLTAIGIAHRAAELGIAIPGQLLLTGGDNIKLSEYAQIPLTTFDQEARACAREAAAMLAAHLDNGAPLENRQIRSRLIYRRSLPEKNIAAQEGKA